MTRPGGAVVPDPVRTELARVVQRWHQLPLHHARSRLVDVRALLARLDPYGDGPPPLEPAVVMDQLTVLVYDVCAARVPHVDPAELPGLLADLRGRLA